MCRQRFTTRYTSPWIKSNMTETKATGADNVRTGELSVVVWPIRQSICNQMMSIVIKITRDLAWVLWVDANLGLVRGPLGAFFSLISLKLPIVCHTPAEERQITNEDGAGEDSHAYRERRINMFDSCNDRTVNALSWPLNYFNFSISLQNRMKFQYFHQNICSITTKWIDKIKLHFIKSQIGEIKPKNPIDCY